MKKLFFVLYLIIFGTVSAQELRTPIKPPVGKTTIKRLVSDNDGYTAWFFIEDTTYVISSLKAFDLGDKVELIEPHYHIRFNIWSDDEFLFKSRVSANKICKELGYKKSVDKVIKRTGYFCMGSPWAAGASSRDLCIHDPDDENGRKYIDSITCLKK